MDVVGRQGREPGDDPSPPPRVRVAQLLAFVALIAALVGALGPADRLRTSYSWPPETLPAETPERAWYTPLLLSMQRPEALSATLPCTLPPPLSGAGSPAVVLATARNPGRVDGLAVTRAGDLLEIRIGNELLDRVDLSSRTPTPAGGECSYRLDITSAQWSLTGGPREVARGGPLEAAPMVTGLFSALDLRSARAPSIDVTTAVHATRSTTRQVVARTLAVLAAAAALLLVAFSGRPRGPRGLVQAVRTHARPVDAVVGVVLVGWWMLAPANIDDGHVIARELTFRESHGFSSYYSSLGSNMALDYWLDWAHHWLTEASASLLILRLPALVCLAVLWVLCRFIAVRILGDTLRGVAVWTLACVFLIGAFAWGMTLRPEPVTAVFVTGVAACMLLFRARQSTWAVATTGALVAFALSAHPAGIISLAAVVVAAPALFRWARSHAAPATAIVAASLALLATLVFVGTDVEQRRYDAQLARTYSYSERWRDEVTRYEYLSKHHYGTPLRRASVALLGLTILAFLVRRRRGQRAPLDFPALVLGVGMVLLVATPSKWPSHFGTLIGVGAIATACEARRIREDGLQATRWRAWPFLAIATVMLGVSWAWLERQSWNFVDLRTLDWTPGFESWFPVARLALLAPLLALVGAFVVARRRHGTEPRHGIPWRVAAWTAPLVTVPVIAFTASILVADAVRTDGWTLTRQNLDTLAGRDLGCGLGEDMLVPVTEEARAVPVRSPARSTVSTPSWVPPAPAPGLARYGVGPSTGDRALSPWFELPADRSVGVFVAGATGPSNRLLVEWGRTEGPGVVPISQEEIDAALKPLSGTSAWRFFAASDLPEREPTANVARIVHAVDLAPGTAVAVTAPVTYRLEPLARRLRASSARTLVLPNVLMYFPCVQLPALRGGTVEVPQTIVAWENEFSPIQFPQTSPFAGVLDLYQLSPLSVTDTPKPPRGVFAYQVERSIPGAEIAAPTATTTVS